jgi:hypothetical protein
MIYLHELLDVQPGMIDEYADAAANHLVAGWNRYCKTVAFSRMPFDTVKASPYGNSERRLSL